LNQIDHKSHTNKTLSGIKWNIIGRILSQASVLIVGIILMRLLLPEDFGTLSMVLVFTGFLSVFTDFGLGSALIYKKDIERSDIDTIFWVSNLLGIFLSILLFIGSPLIAAFYNAPELVLLASVMSLIFVINSLGRTHITLLRKRLLFKQVFLIEIISVFGSSALAIFLAYAGKGVWALVGLHLSKGLMKSTSAWIIVNYIPSFSLSLIRFKEHWNYAYPLLGNQIFNYWTRNADRFFIGKFLGSEQLGFYSRANSLISKPTKEVVAVLGSVLFPSFSLIKDDTIRIKQIYLSAARITTFFILPFLGVIVVFAKPLVQIGLGIKWLPIVPLLMIFPLIGALESFGRLSSSLFLSQGKVRSLAIINILRGSVMIIAFFVGAQYSIQVVAWCLVIVSFIFLIPKLYYGGKSISCSVNEILISIFPNFLAVLVTMVITYFIINNITLFQDSIFLPVKLLLFGLLYLFVNFAIDQSIIKLVIRTVKRL